MFPITRVFPLPSRTDGQIFKSPFRAIRNSPNGISRYCIIPTPRPCRLWHKLSNISERCKSQTPLKLEPLSGTTSLSVSLIQEHTLRTCAAFAESGLRKWQYGMALQVSRARDRSGDPIIGAAVETKVSGAVVMLRRRDAGLRRGFGPGGVCETA